MPDIVTPDVTYPDAPAGFNLSWEDRGVVMTRRGKRRLHRADSTAEFNSAWAYASGRLRDAGYATEDRLDALARTWVPATVLHWGDGSVVPPGLVAEVEVAAAAVAERVRVEHEEHQKVIADGTARAHAALLATASDIGWAWSPAAALQARELLASDSLFEWQWRAADILIARAQDAVSKAEAKSSAQAAEAAEADLAAVEDPAVRDAVLAAVRAITACDDDMATEANQIGWSQATSRPGHVLARESVLDPGRAVVGLRLLRRHHAQVPDALRPMLGVPA